MTTTIRQKLKEERAIAGGRELSLEIRLGEEAPLPAILQLPNTTSTAPAALLLHGLYSRKEVLSESVGRELVLRGIASLSIDLPMHGARDDPASSRSFGNPLQMIGHWKQALSEAEMALGYLRARKEVDSARVGIVGYSMGSHIAAVTAAKDARVRAVVIAAGGDLPEGTPFTAMGRAFADPIRAVRALKGRPLLMVHGRSDRTMRPDQAQRLFDAAGEPKEIRWFDAGHRLPVEAISGVAEWLGKALL